MSEWWSEFLKAGVDAGSRSEQTRKLKEMLGEALSGQADDAVLRGRRRAAYQLAEMATRVWLSKEKADEKRSRAHRAQRVTAGGSAAAAAGSGGALAAGLGGATAAVLGLAVVIIGILAGVAAAVLPEAEYERNRSKARQYEQLWWDIWDYTTLKLPAIEADTIPDQLEKFSAAIRAVGDA